MKSQFFLNQQLEGPYFLIFKLYPADGQTISPDILAKGGGGGGGGGSLLNLNHCLSDLLLVID